MGPKNIPPVNLPPPDAACVSSAVEAKELCGWLVHVQQSLQKTMDEVTKKLEETMILAEVNAMKMEFAKVLTETPQEQEQRVLRDALRSMGPSLQETIVTIKPPQELARSPEEAAVQPEEKDAVKPSLPELPGRPDPPANPAPRLAYPELGETAKKQEQPAKAEVSKQPGEQPIRAAPSLVSRESSIVHSSTQMTLGDPRKKPSLLSRAKHCLLKVLCPCRKVMLETRPPRKLKPAEPTCFFGKNRLYTKEDNDREPLGKKLKGMRKMKAVPTRFWANRVLIEDATGKQFSLKEVEDAKNHNDVAFPVSVKWNWLSPTELYRATWRDSLWWKKVGTLDNMSLRSLSMRMHARMHHCRCEVVLLTEGMIKDVEESLATKTTLRQQTEDYEMEMAIDCLSDIDDLLVLDFDCGGQKVTIGQVTQAAGCPWEAFLEQYMFGRNSALACTTDGRRRELILAAAKGMDGLEQLYGHLCRQIDANDLFVFKMMLLCLNGVTAAAQFAWSDFVVPHFEGTTTTPEPTWMRQINDLATAQSGG